MVAGPSPLKSGVAGSAATRKRRGCVGKFWQERRKKKRRKKKKKEKKKKKKKEEEKKGRKRRERNFEGKEYILLFLFSGSQIVVYCVPVSQ